MSDIGESRGLMWGMTQEFLAGRPDLSGEAEVLREADDRIAGAALALADLSESIGVAMKMGMTDPEIVALLTVAREYMADPHRSMVMPEVEGGFS